MESNRLCSSSLEKEMEVSPGPQVELKLTMSWKEKKKITSEHTNRSTGCDYGTVFFPSAAVLFHLELSAKEAAPDTKLRAVRACPEVQSPQRTERPVSVYW